MGLSSAGDWFGRYSADLSAISRERLVDAFRTGMAGMFIHGFRIIAEPVIVPVARYEELLQATRRLLELQRAAVANLAPDQRGRMQALRSDPAEFLRFVPDEYFEIEHSVDIARADVIVDDSGPKFIEFNVGGGVGGLIEFEMQRRIWRRLLSETHGPALTASDPFASLGSLITRLCRARGVAPAALLIGSLGDPGRTIGHFDAQIGLLQGYGVSARFVDVRRLTEDVGADVDLDDVVGIVQFSDREASEYGWDISQLLRAMRAGLTTVPSQTARLVDSKKILALLSEGLPWMSRSDLELVQQFVPWTRTVRARRVVWRGETYDLPRLLIGRQEHFVLKGAAGLAGKEVFFGAGMTLSEWRDLVAAAVASEYYVAQEVVSSVRHPYRMLRDETGTVGVVSAGAVISPFVVDGEPGGCFIRVDPENRIAPVSRPAGALAGCLAGGDPVVL